MKDIDRNKLALTLLRITLSVLIAIHGWHRFFEGGVVDFGQGLSNRGYPFGLLLAATITGLEMIGSMVFAAGRLVFPLTLIYTFIYCMAIYLHHLPNGWFSSGNEVDGCEYPVLLVIGFICVGLPYAPMHRNIHQASMDLTQTK